MPLLSEEVTLSAVKPISPNLKPFKPGQSGNVNGRPRKHLKRIDEMCAKDGKHPYLELMKLIPDLKPREQAEVWLQLLSYCQPKPKEEIIDDTGISDMSLPDLIEKVKETLISLEVVPK